MDRDKALKLIDNTIHKPFDIDKFKIFTQKLLNSNKTSEISEIIIPESYKECVRKFAVIGKYYDKYNKQIDILAVELSSHHHNKISLRRNIIVWYLNGGIDGELKDAVLVAFYHKNDNYWRFSLIEKTHAEIYTFLAGENEPPYTAKQLLLPLFINKTKPPALEELLNSFNIETVTNMFYEKYKEQVIIIRDFMNKELERNNVLKKEFYNKNITPIIFSKNLIGQIIFLYFLQKKVFLNVIGDKSFIDNIFNNNTHLNFYKDILQVLLYQASSIKDNIILLGDKEYKIPFLNNAFFKPANDFDWKNIKINIPNELFKNNEKSAEGFTGKGIIDVFNRFNFSLKKEDPYEKEMAVDSEMLGKVFERLLEVKDKKYKGKFYTPKEIVNYICREALKNTITNFYQNAHILFEHTNADINNTFTKDELHKIKNIMLSLLIYDPACGAGAFLVGMVNEMSRLITKINNIVGEPSTINERYNIKKQIIQNCIYGVDIDKEAIEITKLRLWLSLIVEYPNINPDKINPIPNLEYNLICGNSLILDYKTQYSNIFNTENTGFDIILANPPYLGHKSGNKDVFRRLKKHNIGKRFNNERMDLFYYFFHKAIDLLKHKGIACFITTNYFLTADSAVKLRNDIKNRTSIIKLVNFNELKIFNTAKGQHNIITILKKTKDKNITCETSTTKRKGTATPEIISNIIKGIDQKTSYGKVKQHDLYDGSYDYIRLYGNINSKENNLTYTKINNILNKISKQSNICLGECFNINQGIITGADKYSKKHDKYNIRNTKYGDGIFIIHEDDLCNLNLKEHEYDIIKPWFKNSDIKRYYTKTKSRYYLIHSTIDIDIRQYGNIYSHLKKYKEILFNRNFESGELSKAKKQNNRWVLSSARKEYSFDSEKIVCPQRRYYVFC